MLFVMSNRAMPVRFAPSINRALCDAHNCDPFGLTSSQRTFNPPPACTLNSKSKFVAESRAPEFTSTAASASLGVSLTTVNGPPI